jgi:diguanylate cyclase (GGDEF)-like protein
MMQSLIERFAFDAAARRRRLALLDIVPDDETDARWLREEVIAPHVDAIVEDHYAVMLRDPEFREIVAQRTSLPRLKRMQSHYLLSFGSDLGSAQYFEARLRVGLVHSAAGVPLSMYACAYRALTQAILDRIPQSERRERATSVVLKVVALDMSLAIETYHASHVEALERSLDRARTAEEEQRRLARRDTLTGLVNRSSVLERLTEAIERAHRTRRKLSLVMIDVDHFKDINDEHGHPAGDQVLRRIAERMRAAVRAHDDVGRWGGEEFVAILPGTDLGHAAEIAERMRRNIANEPIQIEQRQIHVTISQGVVTLEGGEALDGLVARADAAMYRAKREGRNRVAVDDFLEERSLNAPRPS